MATLHHAVSALGRRQRLRVAAFAGVALLLLLAALPVEAADRPLLSHGTISPTTGAAGTTFVIRVTYTSTGHGGRGWAPGSIRVWLDGASTALVATDPSDHDYQDGAVFQATLKPAAGRYHVIIRANDGWLLGGDASALDLGTLVVGAAPTPSPKPHPTPTRPPAPTSRPTVHPTPRPTAVASQTMTAVGIATPGASPAASGPPGPDAIVPAAGHAVPASPSPPPTPGPTTVPRADPLAASMPGGAAAGAAGGGAGGAGVSLAALTAGLPTLGSPAWLELFTRQLLVATAGTTMMALALFTFRRRQAGDDAVPAPQAADPVPPRLGEQVAAAFVAQAPLPLLPGEAGMPRWRRPSLRAARQAKPGTDLAALEAERLTFASSDSDAAPVRGVERRRLRYRLVRLSDGPDEILSRELGLLDQGDEVELLQQSGVYWQVRTPLGQVGWIHRMTLGELVPAAAMGTAVAREPYTEGLAQRLARERLGS